LQKTAVKALQPKQHPQPGRLVSLLLAVLGGLAFGGGGASAWFLMLDRDVTQVQAAVPTAPVENSFVNIPRLTVPMTDPSGNLLGYVTLDLALQVPADRAEEIKQHIPMIRHGLNDLLYGGGNFSQADRPAQLDIKRATPAMLKAANDALPEPVITSLSVITAIPG
jgi:flagellar basal body-associated protein FliL